MRFGCLPLELVRDAVLLGGVVGGISSLVGRREGSLVLVLAVWWGERRVEGGPQFTSQMGRGSYNGGCEV